MENKQENSPESPMDHPDEQSAGTDAPFKIGRLLLVLASAVMLIGVIAILASIYLT